jgi:hypothetical protein
MRKLLTLLLILISLPTFAQTKISQMPNGGDVVSTDIVPLVRSGVNFYGTIASLDRLRLLVHHRDATA